MRDGRLATAMATAGPICDWQLEDCQFVIPVKQDLALVFGEVDDPAQRGHAQVAEAAARKAAIEGCFGKGGLVVAPLRVGQRPAASDGSAAVAAIVAASERLDPAAPTVRVFMEAGDEAGTPPSPKDPTLALDVYAPGCAPGCAPDGPSPAQSARGGCWPAAPRSGRAGTGR